MNIATQLQGMIKNCNLLQMDKSEGFYVKWNTSQRQGQTLNVLPNLWFMK